MSALPESRRERVRRQTLDEIKQHALEQISTGGTAALSLNGIGKAMGMSGPAIYRYFASRDAVLAALVTDGYAALTDAVVAAAGPAAGLPPEERVEALALAYRAWALEQPHRYGMLFGLRPASYRDPDEAIATIDAAMAALLAAIGDAVGGERPGPADDLDGELLRWAADHGLQPDDDPLVLRAGVLAWTRIHGVVALEIAGVFGDMGLDAAALLRAETRGVVALARGAG